MDLKAELEIFEDYLVPKLDTYEQAIYIYVLRHSRMQGKAETTIDNSYRNVVAACLSYNNRKGNSLADEFLRGLYRSGYLSSPEFESRLSALELLRAGELKPALNHRP